MATDYEVQELYVAYFSRPADPDGLAFWKMQLTNHPDLYADVSLAFATSAEYQASFGGMDHRAFVGQIYRNLFSREADTAGMDFWTNALASGAIDFSNAVLGIADGRQGSDRIVYNAKVSVAENFTVRIDTEVEKAAYSGAAATQIAVDYIAGVNSFAAGATYIDPGQIDSAIARIVGIPTGIDFDGMAVL